jgi:hypothetical protein
MIVGTNYSDAWTDLGKRKARLLFLILGFIPGVVFISYIFNLFRSSTTKDFGLIAISWIFAILLAVGHLGGFKCPRCKQLFFIGGWSGYNMMTSKCLNCGLPVNEE